MRTSVAIALVLGLFAACGVLWAMRPPGPGLDPDSMSYLAAAESIAKTGAPRVPFDEWSSAGETRRLRDFPPGFPAAIAALVKIGTSSERAAVWVEAASAFVTIAGVVLVVAAAAGPIAATATAVAILLTPAIVEDHYIVLSEPLFLSLVVVLLALAASERPRVWALGIVAGAAAMVRYAGLALPLAATVGTAIAPTGRRRGVAPALAGAPGVVAFLAWSRWAGKVREFGWKGGFASTLREGGATLTAWLLPLAAPSSLRPILLAVSLASLLIVFFRGVLAASPGERRLLAATTLVAACYAALVAFSRLFADEAIPFDGRIASPLFLLATIAVVTSVAAQWRTSTPILRAALGAAGVLWCVASARVTLGELRELTDDGWGYASADWIASDLGKWLAADHGRHALFSDNPPALYSMTHRPSRSLPETTDAPTVARFREVLSRTPSLVVAFTEPDAPAGAHGRDFARLLSLREVRRTADGSVFAIAW